MAPRLARRAPRAAAAVGVVMQLVACQPLPHPFAGDVPPPGSPILTLRDSASVTIAPVDGTPRATAEKLPLSTTRTNILMPSSRSIRSSYGAWVITLRNRSCMTLG